MLNKLLYQEARINQTTGSSAIPGSHARDINGEEFFFWRVELPYVLPDQAILDSLVRQYFLSVNWFMHVCALSLRLS